VQLFKKHSKIQCANKKTQKHVPKKPGVERGKKKQKKKTGVELLLVPKNTQQKKTKKK